MINNVAMNFLCILFMVPHFPLCYDIMNRKQAITGTLGGCIFMSTDAKRAGNMRYHEKLERVVYRLHKDGSDGFTKDQVEAAAAAAGQSVNAWIIEAIRDKL